MRLKRSITSTTANGCRRPMLALLLALAGFALPAFADVSFTLTPSVLLSDGTNEVAFTGTLSNTSPTDLAFLNDNQFAFTDASSTNLSADTNAFFANVPGILLPGETYSDTVFAVSLGTNAAPGDYYGTVTIQGGTNIFETNTLASLSFEVATYAGLTVTPASFQRPTGVSLKVMISSLLNHCSDASTDAIVVSAVNPVSTNGVNLASTGSLVFYTNSVTIDAADSFGYTVTDAVGRTATGTVLIAVQTSGTAGQGQTPIITDNQATLVFAGIPSREYLVQRSINLTTWITILTTNAPATGIMVVNDNFSDLGGVAPNAAFYRLLSP